MSANDVFNKNEINNIGLNNVIKNIDEMIEKEEKNGK
jgi:hypothetical protein